MKAGSVPDLAGELFYSLIPGRILKVPPMWQGNLAHRSAAFRRQNSTKCHALTTSRALLLSTVLPHEGSAPMPSWYCPDAPLVPSVPQAPLADDNCPPHVGPLCH